MIKTRPLSLEDISEITKETRELFHIKPEEFFPIFDVLKILTLINELNLQVIDNSSPLLSDNEPAAYNAYENFIYIKEEVLDEYDSGDYRSSFTLCHEFAHFLQAQWLKFDFYECDKCMPYEDVEWQANEIAGQLLVPDKFLSLDGATISKQFHVSLECALTRKVKLKRRLQKKFNT